MVSAVASEGHTDTNRRWLSRALWLVLIVFGVSALAYFMMPAASLRVVGIVSDATERFLLRTLAAALLAFVVLLWLAVARPSTSLRYGLVWGVVTYLVASSLVDLAAYMGGIVSVLSIPSALLRIVLAGWLVVLQRRGGEQDDLSG
jgi:cell division protein FtsW (lipid II flippase)